MDKEQAQELVSILIDFMKRAAQKDATPEEIAVLPEVAKVLVSIAVRCGL